MINVENTRIELEHLYIKSYILCVRWFTKLLQVLVYLRIYQTDCFNACLLDIFITQTSSRQSKEINNSKTPKPPFSILSKGNLQPKLKFKVKFLKLSFLLNL